MCGEEGAWFEEVVGGLDWRWGVVGLRGVRCVWGLTQWDDLV